MIEKYLKIWQALLLAAIFVSGIFSCRGQNSKKPPIHLNPNMDRQEKFIPYGENNFFKDKRNMRPIPEGTVPRGHLEEDEAYYKGMSDSQMVAENPETITLEFLKRGQERYSIYCSMCHGEAGYGNGIVIKRGFVPPPSYHDERIRNLKDGELYRAISFGIRNMAGYGKQISPKDRWAIVAYIRALQRSQNAMPEDMPKEVEAAAVKE